LDVSDVKSTLDVGASPERGGQEHLTPSPQYPTALEAPDFPFEHLSEIAELESWRKEINRPIYHLHKWWAQRLGSVFRAIAIAAFVPRGADILDLFYKPLSIADKIIFDPFMGSGTTVGEALKLGARAIGRDINPVAHFVVKTSLGRYRREEVLSEFQSIEADVAPEIRQYYQACLADGSITDVLYYFWVKSVPCPECTVPVDLFSTYQFVHHAYPGKHPLGRALCPKCSAIVPTDAASTRSRCPECGYAFDVHLGPANGTSATCPACLKEFQILKAVQLRDGTPAHRLYAKAIVGRDGRKDYVRIEASDLALYETARAELQKRDDWFPRVGIAPGYNTDQARNYGYHFWHQMFNDRQLLALGTLAHRIRKISDEPLRGLFACLFSGALEFNNMFASFKGEGTGAVRHMFSHHILKPERVPLEANPWGTPKSSGSFSTLFQSRILRALEYRDRPFELRPVYTRGHWHGEKVYDLSRPIGDDVFETYEDFNATSGRMYLSCGDSGVTDIPDNTVDAIITDPPFFDNVHYSELADFFHIWQRHLDVTRSPTMTTRHQNEVQTADPTAFGERLARVWREAHRVLRPGGLMSFTYHHSKTIGWKAILESLVSAGFVITATQPIKAEMSVAQPKHQAKEPINLDIVIACRKRGEVEIASTPRTQLLSVSRAAAAAQARRFGVVARSLSRNDIRVILMAQLIRALSHCTGEDSVDLLGEGSTDIEAAIEEIYGTYNTDAAESSRFKTQFQRL
jgi:adenine-specific DNA methylase